MCSGNWNSREILKEDLDFAKNQRDTNRLTLMSFVNYCAAHPDERFWQALRNWAGVGFIIASAVNLSTDDSNSAQKIEDTFSWRCKDGRA